MRGMFLQLESIRGGLRGFINPSVIAQEAREGGCARGGGAWVCEGVCKGAHARGRAHARMGCEGARVGAKAGMCVQMSVQRGARVQGECAHNGKALGGARWGLCKGEHVCVQGDHVG